MGLLLSILRGINVSGYKKVPMTELQALYEALGFSHVRTYIQSGNVIFETNRSQSRVLAQQIEHAIQEKFGFEVPVLLRSANELAAVLKNNPFLKQPDTDPGQLHVTFLAEPPTSASVEKINQQAYEPDQFAIVGQEVYVLCPGGYGRTKLTNTFFENKLKTAATTRNWRTVNELAKLMSQ